MPTILRLPRWCVFALLLLLAASAFLHLGADFPNHSRWADDAAKFTDEGWYASGAINHTLTGQWLVAGNFNPVIGIPLWSAVMELLFHFAGISVVLARAVAIVFTIGTVLLCGQLMSTGNRRLAPVLMLLVGTSPLLYFFSRLAILEPALIFFLCAASAAAYAKEPPGAGRSLLCGVLFTLAILSKSSALFVAPAVLYLLWFPHRRLWRSQTPERGRAMRAMLVPVLTFTVCYGLYWLMIIRTHRADFQVLYDENKIHLGLQSLEKCVRILYRSVTWVDPIVFPVAALAVVLSVRWLRALWLQPLFGYAILLFAGYSAFMVLHFDAEPHYFVVLVVPVAILAALLAEALEARSAAAARAVGALLLLATAINLGMIAWPMAHPQYTLRDACAQLAARIEADPSANPLVIGHGAIETTLFTRIPALDDLGSMPLERKLAELHPGWVVTWNDNFGPFEQPAVVSRYRFVEVASWPALDNADRKALVLYRIEPMR